MAAVNDDERKELFTEFFQRHVAQIRSFARKKVPNSSDVEDICADTFALAWARLDELCDLTDAQAHRWLQRVVEFRIQRTSRDFTRFNRAIQKISKEVRTNWESSELSYISGLDRLDENSATQLVAEVMSQLTAEQRELLTWDIYENLKGPAIAKRLNCSPTAARLRLMRARRAFADCLNVQTQFINTEAAE